MITFFHCQIRNGFFMPNQVINPLEALTMSALNTKSGSDPFRRKLKCSDKSIWLCKKHHLKLGETVIIATRDSLFIRLSS
jgi:hypothetical protein